MLIVRTRCVTNRHPSRSKRAQTGWLRKWPRERARSSFYVGVLPARPRASRTHGGVARRHVEGIWLDHVCMRFWQLADARCQMCACLSRKSVALPTVFNRVQHHGRA